MEFFQSYKAGIKCLLININFKYNHNLNADLSELKKLVLAANKIILESIDFNHKKPYIKYFCGISKMEIIKNKCEEIKADLIIFNHILSPSQERNIEKFLECKIMDRNRLILEIFSLRAKTHEGKLQVELAKLNYQSTRLVKGWTHLERQKGGIGVKSGPGETQLEIDRRLIRNRTKQITKNLNKVKNSRGINRASRKRNSIPTISFVGYTNAGKSTLFNKITNSQVITKNQFFVTLDPTLRQVVVPKLGKVIFSDTVGFIKNLPHTLIEAFNATLKEVIESDILIHVIDYSDKYYKSYIEQVEKVLEEIGIKNKAIIYVYNKIDQFEYIKPNLITFKNTENFPVSKIYLSAKTGEGINQLYDALSKFFHNSCIHRTLELPPKHYKVISMMYEIGIIDNVDINEKGNYLLKIKISENHLKEFNKSCALNLEDFFV